MNRPLSKEIELLQERIQALEEKLIRNQHCIKIVDHVTDIITIVDETGTIKAVSPSFERVLGHSHEKALGRNASDYLHPDDAKTVRNVITDIIGKEHANHTSIQRLRRSDGKYRTFETISANYLDDPDIRGIISSSRDITERLETELRVTEERDRAQSYLDIADVIIMAVDSEGIITLINRKGCDILGYNECNLVGSPFIPILIPERDRRHARVAFNRMIRKGVGDYEYIENKIVTSTGEERIISWRNTLIKKCEGRIIGLLSSGEDITDKRLAVERLRASEESYRLMFENNPYPMWVYEYGTLRFLAVNRAAVEHYGYTREEFLNMTIKDIRPPDEIPHLLESLDHVKPGIDYAGVWRHQMKDGTPILVEITSHPITFDGQNAELVLSQDVTLHYEVQESLRLSEEKYHSLFNSMSEGVVIVEPVYATNGGDIEDFEVMDINPVFTTIFGIKKKDIVGKRGGTFVKFQELQFYLDCMSKVLSMELPYTFEVNYDKIGKIVQVSLFPVIGDILAAVFQDITDRKNAIEEIKRNRDRLNILLRNERLISDVASRLNTSEQFEETLTDILHLLKKSVNLSYICMFKSDDGQTGDDYFMSWMLADCPEKNDPHQCCPFKIESVIDNLAHNDEYMSDDLKELSKKDRDYLIKSGVRSFIAISINIGGFMRGAMCFGRGSGKAFRDDEREMLRTAGKIIVNAIERDYNVRARINAEKQRTLAVQMAERASRLASLGTMAAGIAHEINQPLNALMFTVDGMRYWKKRNHEIKSDELDENLEFISDQISRISEIIATMRSMVRIGDTSKKEYTVLNKIIEEVASLIRQQMMAHDIDVTISLDDSIPDIYCNQSRLRQVVTNLIVNAFQALDGYAISEKKIHITTAAADNAVVFTVTDNGPGIDKSIIGNLFDPFFTTKTSGDSMGLGLFIAHSIITELGGIISVENVSGGGARFSVSIPMRSKPETDDEHCTC